MAHGLVLSRPKRSVRRVFVSPPWISGTELEKHKSNHQRTLRYEYRDTTMASECHSLTGIGSVKDFYGSCVLDERQKQKLKLYF
ncbi:uncharacterized [Tachysurus ichikawai]